MSLRLFLYRNITLRLSTNRSKTTKCRLRRKLFVMWQIDIYLSCFVPSFNLRRSFSGKESYGIQLPHGITECRNVSSLVVNSMFQWRFSVASSPTFEKSPPSPTLLLLCITLFSTALCSGLCTSATHDTTLAPYVFLKLEQQIIPSQNHHAGSSTFSFLGVV